LFWFGFTTPLKKSCQLPDTTTSTKRDKVCKGRRKDDHKGLVQPLQRMINNPLIPNGWRQEEVSYVKLETRVSSYLEQVAAPNYAMFVSLENMR
jgi:hypothetical protein